MAAKTFEFDEELPDLPLPELNDTLNLYLDTLRPFLSLNTFKEVEVIVRDFENGIGQKLQEKLQERACNNKNWLEAWWQKYAYLRIRDSLLLSSNFVGNWIPVGHSILHEMVKKNTTMENRRSKSISCLLYQVCRYWCKLRSQSVVPFRDGSGKTYSMHQSKFLFNTSRLPGQIEDEILCDFQTEDSKRECSDINHIVVLYKGQFFKFVPFDDNGEPLLPTSIETAFKEIEDIAQSKVDLQTDTFSLGSLTGANRTLWSKHYSFLSENYPQEMRSIANSICMVILSDKEPNTESEQLKLGLFHDHMDVWADKSLTFMAFKNGAISSQSEHSALDGIASAECCSFCLIEFAAMEMNDCATNSKTMKMVVDVKKLEFELSDEIITDCKNTSLELRSKANDLSFELHEFFDFGKTELKRLRLHPDAFVQVCLQVAAYKTHNRALPTYETATTRQFYHGRTETVRSCTEKTFQIAKAMCDLEETISKESKKKLFENAIANHVSLMEQCKKNKGCDRHLLGLQIAAMDSGISEIPEIFTHSSYKLSGGGGNFLLSTSLAGYSRITGGCNPMTPDGYGVFYGIPPESILFWMCTNTQSDFSNAEELKKNLMKTFNEVHELFQ